MVHGDCAAELAAQRAGLPRIRARRPHLPAANRACLPPSDRGDPAAGLNCGRRRGSRVARRQPHPPAGAPLTPTDRGAATGQARAGGRCAARGVHLGAPRASRRRHPPSTQARSPQRPKRLARNQRSRLRPNRAMATPLHCNVHKAVPMGGNLGGSGLEHQLIAGMPLAAVVTLATEAARHPRAPTPVRRFEPAAGALGDPTSRLAGHGKAVTHAHLKRMLGCIDGSH